RFDKIIVFKPLNAEAIKSIVDLQLNDLMHRLEKQKIKLLVTDGAKAFLAERGFEPELGARPVRRLVQTMIEDRLAEGILSREFAKGSVVSVDNQKNNLVLTKSK